MSCFSLHHQQSNLQKLKKQNNEHLKSLRLTYIGIEKTSQETMAKLMLKNQTHLN